MSLTLSLYVARRFLGTFLTAFVVIFFLVVLIDLVELLRRGAKSDASFIQFVELAVLHAPSLMLVILPFIALIAAMACFARLARSSELVVTRAAGVSVWRLIAPTLLAAGAVGVISFSVYNPVAAGTLQRFERLKARYFDDATSLLSFSSTGLWLREGTADSQTVIRAKRANTAGTTLWDVTLLTFDPEDKLLGRVEAGRAVLSAGAWTLHQVRRWDFTAETPSEIPERIAVETFRVRTNLTQAQILESFSAPQTISFWKLPQFIANMEESGFAATRHRMFWQSQVAAPLLFAAMVLIGASFSMRHVRFGGLGWMAAGAVGTGIGYFFLANVTQAFGNSGAIAPPLAAWIPPFAMALLSIGLLLHLEDG